MDLQMNGKTALVTGGSAGIGKAIALPWLARVSMSRSARAASSRSRQRRRKLHARQTAKSSPYRLI